LNKFEICSYLKFVQIRFLFKIKKFQNRNLNQFQNLNCLNFRKENRKKTKKNREEALPEPAQHQHHARGAE
jgi:hypothetical protein